MSSTTWPKSVGAAFAQLEMTVVMRTIAEEVELEPAEPEAEPVGRRAIVLAPKPGRQGQQEHVPDRVGQRHHQLHDPERRSRK